MHFRALAFLSASPPPTSSSDWFALALLLSLRLPVVEKLFQAHIGQRMFKQRLEYAVRHRADVTASQCRLDHVLWVADACDQDQCLVVIVLVNRQDLTNEFHPA